MRSKVGPLTLCRTVATATTLRTLSSWGFVAHSAVIVSLLWRRIRYSVRSGLVPVRKTVILVYFLVFFIGITAWTNTDAMTALFSQQRSSKAEDFVFYQKQVV